MEASHCKHFQNGHCNFCDHCNKQHINELSQTEYCSKITCTKRHPKICKYFNTYCRFGNKCSFKHVTTKTQNDTAELESKTIKLEECIQIISSQINSLQKKYPPSRIFFQEQLSLNVINVAMKPALTQF